MSYNIIQLILPIPLKLYNCKIIKKIGILWSFERRAELVRAMLSHDKVH